MTLPDNARGRWLALATLIIPGVAATESFAILPVMLGIVAHGWALKDDALGILAAVELGGLAVGTLTAVIAMRHLGGRTTALGAMLLLMLANSAALFAPDVASLMALRAVAGLAAGAGLAVCYVNLGSTPHPERNFAIFTFLQLLLGALGLIALPVLASHVGWGAPYVLLGASALLGLIATLLSPALDNSARTSLPQSPAHHLPSLRRHRSGLFALLGIGFYFVGITAVWAYLDRIGNGASLSSSRIATIVAASQIVAMAGAVAASLLAGRISVTVNLLSGSLMTAAGIIMLAFSHNLTSFTLAVALISFAWNYVTAPQFAAVASVDKDGALVGLMSTVTGVGAAAGPAFGSQMVGNGYNMLLVVSALLMLASIPLILPATRPGAAPRTH